MTTRHWLRGGFDTVWTAGINIGDVDLVVPAGGIVKRFLLRQVSITGYVQGFNYNSLTPLRMLMSVNIIAGEYAPRDIYLTHRRVPSDYVGLYDIVDRNYTQYVNGGDLELGFNQRASYGTAGGPGMTIRFRPTIFKDAACLTTPTGKAIYQFCVLYEI